MSHAIGLLHNRDGQAADDYIAPRLDAAAAWSIWGPTMLLLGPAVAMGPGAGGGNRTLIASLEGWSSTIELHPRTSSFTEPDVAAQLPMNIPQGNRLNGSGIPARSEV